MGDGVIRLVPLEEKYIPSIVEIDKRSEAVPWSEASFQNELSHPHGVFYVAVDSDEVVGYAGMWLIIDEAHITTIAVSPERRREGIGRILMVALLEEAKRRGIVCSTLEVRAGNVAAIMLYERLGYLRVAVRRAYYPDNREDALVMWLYDLQGWTP